MAARQFQIKDFKGTLKDVDSSSRTVCGYFASFGTLDSDGDVFDPRAFDVSLVQNKDRIMHLLQHDTLQPIGRPALKADKTGLYFETPIANTPLGDDTLQLYIDGVYNEHSVGFEQLKSKPDQDGAYDTYTPSWDPDNERAANIITEAKLWEGSTVTWGANQNTPFIGVKTASMEDVLKHISARKNLLLKSLHKGNLMDETYLRLEKELEALCKITAVDPAPASQPANATALLKQLTDLNNSIK